MSEREPISLSVRDRVAWLQIERRERLNALNRSAYIALRAHLEQLALGDVRVIVLGGAGRAFCAGADLKAREEDPAARDVERTLCDFAHPVIRALRRAPQPVVAAVNGVAVGIGCALALACDVVLAAESASFSLPFTRIGLGPDGGVVTLASARAGRGRVAEMLLLGERVPARRAYEWGLVDRLVADEGFDAAVAAVADRLAAMAPRAVTAAKHALDAQLELELERELELEVSTQGELARSADHSEGLAAFRDRRPARFAGS